MEHWAWAGSVSSSARIGNLSWGTAAPRPGGPGYRRLGWIAAVAAVVFGSGHRPVPATYLCSAGECLATDQ